GEREQRRRHRDSERLGGLEVNDQLELGRCLDWKIAWTFALENASDVARRPGVHVTHVYSVRDQTTAGGIVTEPVDRWQAIPCRLRDDKLAVNRYEGARYHDKAGIRLGFRCGNGALDISRVGDRDHDQLDRERGRSSLHREHERIEVRCRRRIENDVRARERW